MSSKQGRSRSPVSAVARGDGGPKPGDRGPGRGELAEVEAEIAAAPELPEDIAGELEPVEVPEADIGNTVRLRNAWIAVKQLEAGWKKAREKADSEAEALKEERGALEADRAALTERSDQLEDAGSGDRPSGTGA